jgi:hypothetical protein
MRAGGVTLLPRVAVGRAFATGTLLWFFLDSAVSVASGAYLNLPGNLLFLALMLVSSLALGREGAARAH